MWLRILPFLAALLLALAILHWPIGYYTVLRWSVCIISVVLTWTDVNAGRIGWWSIAMVAIAILFNPLAPVYMSKSVWRPIDIVAAILFVVFGVMRLRGRGTS